MYVYLLQIPAWSFPQKNGHEWPLQDIFLQWLKKNCSAYHAFCKYHSCEKLIVDKFFHVAIRKFVKENKVPEELKLIYLKLKLFQNLKFLRYLIYHAGSSNSTCSFRTITGHNKKMKKFLLNQKLYNYSQCLPVLLYWKNPRVISDEEDTRKFARILKFLELFRED